MDLSHQFLSDIVIWNKYAKYLPHVTRRENWVELCLRNRDMHIKKYPKLTRDIVEVYDKYIIPKKVLPSMRSMQFAGLPIELNNSRIFNCAYEPVDHPFVFSEAMFLLLGGCFKQGTMIRTKQGPKPIESVSVQDQIMTYDSNFNTFSWKHPQWAGVTPTKNKQKVKLVISNNTVVHTTFDHKFYTTNRGWVIAKELTAQDIIVGSTEIILHVEEYEDPEDYYDLSVEGTHSYCLENGMVVHNTGFGYSVQQHHIEQLPVIVGPNEKTRRFLVGDSIEGWADAIKVLIKAYTTGKSDPIFDYRDIRPKGARLITAGGKAPGPDPLRVCIEQVRSVLNGAIGRKLRSIEVHDIMCYIADSVLSGGIRRCLTNDTSVVLESGELIPIDQVKVGTRINDGSGSTVTVKHVFDNGEKPIVKVLLEDNSWFECTDNHYWYVFDNNTGKVEWTRTELLMKGSYAMVDHDTGAVNNIVNVVNEHVTKQVYDIEVDSELHAFKAVSSSNAIGISHNSAMISFFSPDDLDMVSCKSGNWYELNPQRGRANNSAVFKRDTVKYDEFMNVWRIISKSGSGEPGVYFTSDWDVLSNPCVEATLKPHSFCNLTELCVSDICTQEELNNRARAAAFIGTLQASYTDFHYLRPCWKRATEEDALLGVSMTGIASSTVMQLNQTEAAEIVVQENIKRAEILGINPAARTTLVKPSGTASLVVGSSSGIHAWHDKYYIRRKRIGKNEAIYSYLLNKVPELLEDCYFKPHLEAVLSVPQKAPDNAVLRNESALDLLNRVLLVNKNWIAPGHQRGVQKHNVSCTVSVKEHEWNEVGEWLWKHRDNYNGVAVLPYDGHTYIQPPYESCTKEKYEELMKLISEIDLNEVVEMEDNTNHNVEPACAGGACEIK